jgi:hypothetical protein
MIKTIEERIKEHLPGRYQDTLACYDCFTHEDWEDITEEGELVGFISYFYLDFGWDMIITAAKDNKFSKEQWRILRDTLIKRVKPIRIQSDPNNPALVKGAARFGGVFVEDEIHFPYPWEGKYKKE